MISLYHRINVVCMIWGVCNEQRASNTPSKGDRNNIAFNLFACQIDHTVNITLAYNTLNTHKYAHTDTLYNAWNNLFTSELCDQTICGGGSGANRTIQVKFIVEPLLMNKSGPPTISVIGSVDGTKKKKTIRTCVEYIDLKASWVEQVEFGIICW